MHSLALLFLILQGGTLKETNNLYIEMTQDLGSTTRYYVLRGQIATNGVLLVVQGRSQEITNFYGKRTATVPANSYCQYDPMAYVTGMKDYSRVSREQYDG